MNRTAAMLKRFRTRIEQKANDRSKPPVLIVCLGDSVTMGATSYDTFDYDNVYHNQLKRLLEKQYSQTVFSVINAGVAGETAADGLVRVERDIIAHKPDLVIVGFGLNDVRQGLAGVKPFGENLAQIISEIKTRSDADVIVLTPNHMAGKNNPNIHQSQEHILPDLMRLQNERVLQEYSREIVKLAEEYGVCCVDVYAIWDKLKRDGLDTDMFLANGLNHPNACGHKIPAHEIMKLICPEFEVDEKND